ncbi:Uma2 family endonuclease [Rhodoflexus caldus]|uniref:Uma2 family endonuclease n=1 Tax=Rhodoflexus caldus TaxID=2891236 RepID=UPI00202A5E0F|nr:Uma2 family endonuclease [Rhodoflexus caldus]
MQPVTSLSQLDPNGVYTYADYLQWQLEETVELIKGKIFPMSPAPGATHQRISRKLMHFISNCFWEKSCEVFSAPFDVRLLDGKKSAAANRDIFTVVQPDISIICDAAKIDEAGCLGAPDLIVEILSKGNSKKEMKHKFSLYEENGVREYWIVVPYEQFLQQFILDENNRYRLHDIYTAEDLITSFIFSDLQIPLQEVFG